MNEMYDEQGFERRLEREAELVELSDLPTIAMWLAGAIGSGVLGNAAYDTIKGAVSLFRKRKGERQVVQLAARTLQLLREAQPYEPEITLKVKGVELLAQAGTVVRADDLPACPASPRPQQVERGAGAGRDPFIAYPPSERVFAVGLHTRLVARGLRPFVDCCDLPAGTLWPEAIMRALAEARRIVFLLPELGEQAWYQRDEILRAIERIQTGETIGIPVFLGARPPMAQVPYGLAGLQSLSLAELGSLDALADLLAR